MSRVERMSMRKRRLVTGGLAAVLSLLSLCIYADTPLRITQLQRCGNVLDSQQPTYCVQVSGLQSGPAQLRFNGAPVPTDRIEYRQNHLRVRLNAAAARSAPLLVAQRGEPPKPSRRGRLP